MALFVFEPTKIQVIFVVDGGRDVAIAEVVESPHKNEISAFPWT
jgi:hypothetical protein